MTTSSSSHQAQLLDGREAAQSLRESLAAALETEGYPDVTLATVMVGEDEASERYIRMRDRQADRLGLLTRQVRLPADIGQDALEDSVRELAADPEVHGIIVQLPLPEGLDADAVTELLPPEKDIDGLTERNLGRLVRGETGLLPSTPLGVVRLMGHYGIATEGRRAVIVGRSTVVGLPLMLLLSARGADATVTLAHSRTPNLASVTGEADILVAAAGSPGLITGEHVRPGAAVFDVGMTPTEAGIRGDVDFDSVREVAGAITPMPGGTGPMTVACVLENTVKAARLQGRLSAG